MEWNDYLTFFSVLAVVASSLAQFLLGKNYAKSRNAEVLALKAQIEQYKERASEELLKYYNSLNKSQSDAIATLTDELAKAQSQLEEGNNEEARASIAKANDVISILPSKIQALKGSDKLIVRVSPTGRVMIDPDDVDDARTMSNAELIEKYGPKIEFKDN